MLTPLSVIILAHNQAPELRKHLPAILEQDHDFFEVIVVDMASADETKDVLESLELRNPNLRHTHTPTTARDISLERLALTLGIRSARYDWVLITHADCQPESNQWLRTFGEKAQEDKDILVGVAKYDDEQHTWFDRKVNFFRLWNTLAYLHHIRAGHPAVRCDGCNVALRRSLFLGENGFGGHLNLLTGTEELLINRLSTARNTAVVDVPKAIVVEDRLSGQREWKKNRVFYMETRKYQCNTFAYRLKQDLRQFLLWLIIMGGIVLGALLNHYYPNEATATYIITSLVTLLVIFLGAVWLNHWRRAAQAIGYSHSYVLTALPFMLVLPFWNLSAWLEHLLTPKSVFRKKFV